MKIRNFIFTTAIFILCGSLFSTAAFSSNLMEIYQSAIKNDPTYKAADAKWMADRENLSISKSALFPQIGANVTASRSRNETEWPSGIHDKHFNNTTGYSLQISQPIFNFGNWAQIWGAQALVKQAQATFLAAKEDLLQRTSKAYFDVLLAKDVLYFARSNKAALSRLLNQAKHKFDVGLTAITDLEEARANYDITVAEEIAANNDLANSFERLNEITGVRYSYIDPIRDSFPLISPEPANIEQWVKTAEKQNFSLLATRFNATVARENVKIANAGHLPTLTATGNYNYRYNDNNSRVAAFQRDKTATAGLELQVPVFQGGKVAATARQADYNYQKAVAEQEKAHRSIISNTRQTYLGILSNISKIKADKQAIKSARSSLRATKAGYSAGTRTMTDVLTAQTQLYKTQKDFAKDEYDYITQLLTLKQLIGALKEEDLDQLNVWLIKPNNKVTNKKSFDKKPKKKSSRSNAVPPAPEIVVLKTEDVRQAGNRK